MQLRRIVPIVVSEVVRKLDEINIRSIYHELYDEEQGKETKPTLYFHRKPEKPYHIDYAFASNSLKKGDFLDIGEPQERLEFSNHMPIVFNIML